MPMDINYTLSATYDSDGNQIVVETDGDETTEGLMVIVITSNIPILIWRQLGVKRHDFDADGTINQVETATYDLDSNQLTYELISTTTMS